MSIHTIMYKCVGLLVLLATTFAYGLENMNGDYAISNANRGAKATYSTRYGDRGGGIDGGQRFG